MFAVMISKNNKDILSMKTSRFHRFHFRKHLTCHESGFTLAELLIVVAIIGVLVAISIPIFNAQMEKARQAVDVHNARSIESALVIACNSGDIQLPAGVANQGVWVMFCKDGKRPKDYSVNVYCGADSDIIINAEPSGKFDGSNGGNEKVIQILKDCGIDPSSLTIRSNGNQKDGWDWIVVEVGYDANQKIFTRFYSGFAGNTSQFSQIAAGSTNIEKKIYGDQK